MHFYGIDPQKFLPTPKCLYLRKSSKSSPGIFLPYFIFYVALRQISRNVLLSKMAPELEFLTQNIIFYPSCLVILVVEIDAEGDVPRSRTGLI